MEQIFGTISVCGIVSAALCGAIAYREERSVFWGIVFGYLGGLLSIIVYLIIGNKKY